MPGEQATPTPQAPQPSGNGQTPPQAQPPVQPDAQAPGPVPYDRFKEVNDQLRELKQWREKQEADAKAAREKQLAEQAKWQELAEQRAQELEAERLRNTRQQVAMQKGIPVDLMDRLQGSTPEELQADADRLLAYIKPAAGPGVPPAPRNSQPTEVDLSKMNASQIRKQWKSTDS